jgi:hypothetical protein
MKETPILFSAPMVRAILEGRKTQTRRVVKHRYDHLTREPYYATGRVLTDLPTQPGAFMEFRYRQQDTPGFTGSPASTLVPCPYGKPGDRLWVKETWRTAKSLDGKSPSAISDMCIDAGYKQPWAPLSYDADGHRNNEWRGFELNGDAEPGKTRVSIHMPRWASRLMLHVANIRVERLNDISEADCIAEGTPGGHGSIPGYNYSATPWEHYRHLWESLNGPGSWAANPWVWVIELKQVQP